MAAQKPKPPKPVLPVEIQKGRLIYHPDTVTGDRIPDYSYAGYKASEQAIPNVPVKILVPPVKGDATAILQHALDEAAALPVDANGFRGTVLLSRGVYQLSGSLVIRASGIVLRGFGAQDQTLILGTGIQRNGLIRIQGRKDKKEDAQGIRITDGYVPVNAMQFRVASASGLKPGDAITITRPSTQAWIDLLGTQSFGGGISALGWKPGDIDLHFDRIITRVNGNTIEIDAPLTTALDQRYGGGTVHKYDWPGRIQQVGIENISLASDYNKQNPKDEEHNWIAITMDDVMDAWVRQVSFKHFAGSAVHINETARRVTVEDCISTAPVSEIGGERRNTFFTRGQQTLFQRCYAEQGYHDFSAGYGAAGPNAFVQCVSIRPYSFSGTTGMWASGILFDIVEVDGNAIRVGNRGQDGKGAGWTGANCFFWNCSAALIECARPPTAQNWSYGSWSQFAGRGFWAESNNHVSPRSFFYAQLSQRLSQDFSERASVLGIGGEASSSPTVEAAAQLNQEAFRPKPLMKDWIVGAALRQPIPTTHQGARTIAPSALSQQKKEGRAPEVPMELVGGRLAKGNILLTGKVKGVPWWSGGSEATDLRKAAQNMAITRFVPGRVGPGLTDELTGVVDSMKAHHIVALNQHYGLWYERRRDDHERIRRMDGDVWAPFYELPFARSGIDSAWDGLSKYDLTRYNSWYFKRMQDFADLADQEGLVLIYQHYFQHNIIEAGAHYADFPWRTANNINQTGFTEPVHYAGEKRIFYDGQFYDVTNAARNDLHRQYIERCLDNFSGSGSVIHFISEEYTGPLPFVEFWLQTIGQWKQQHAKAQKQWVGLSTTKDVQDAILKNPAYTNLIDVINIEYWHYQADGSVYAPAGGKHLAPRQWARLLKPKSSSFEQVYRAVREYRDAYPEKAVLYNAVNADQYGWAVFMAGGSLPVLPPATDPKLLAAGTRMHATDQYKTFAIEDKNGLILYGKNDMDLDLSHLPGNLSLSYIDLNTGTIIGKAQKIKGGSMQHLKLPKAACLIWIRK
ncbi:DUF6298 domain-containing protein [Niabella terrae]